MVQREMSEGRRSVRRFIGLLRGHYGLLSAIRSRAWTIRSNFCSIRFCVLINHFQTAPIKKNIRTVQNIMISRYVSDIGSTSPPHAFIHKRRSPGLTLRDSTTGNQYGLGSHKGAMDAVGSQWVTTGDIGLHLSDKSSTLAAYR